MLIRNVGWALLRVYIIILLTKNCGKKHLRKVAIPRIFTRVFTCKTFQLYSSGCISCWVAPQAIHSCLVPENMCTHTYNCNVARQPFSLPSLPRHVWDKTVVGSWRVATIDHQTEVFQYVTHSSPPHSDRDHCILRAWHRDVPTGRYVVVSTSVSHPQAELRAGVRVVHLASHFLLQPEEHGTQVTAICREDWR